MKKITLFFLFPLLLFFYGCGGVPFLDDDEQEVFDGIQFKTVGSSKQDGELSHPKTLPQTYVTNVVSSLYYKINATGDIYCVFNKDDIESISNQLIGLFQQINNEEKLSFSYFGQSGRETKGYTYIDSQGRWNWVFTKIKADTFENSWEIYTGKYFSFKKIATLLQGDVVKKNWVQTTQSMIPEKAQGIAGITPSNSDDIQNPFPKNYIPQKEINKVNDANKRIRFLNKLREGGYISDEDYEEQKRRILDRL